MDPCDQHVNSCKAYLCLVHGKVENRLQCVSNRYAELGGTEGRGGCRADRPYHILSSFTNITKASQRLSKVVPCERSEIRGCGG